MRPRHRTNEAVLAPLNATGNLAYSYQSTAIEAWLIDQQLGQEGRGGRGDEGACRASSPPTCSWGDRYVLTSSGRMTKAERAWWAQHGQKLVDTMASRRRRDVVGLLKDRTSYGVYGDHGGAQKEVQRIPMVMYAKGMKHIDSERSVPSRRRPADGAPQHGHQADGADGRQGVQAADL